MGLQRSIAVVVMLAVLRADSHVVAAATAAEPFTEVVAASAHADAAAVASSQEGVHPASAAFVASVCHTAQIYTTKAGDNGKALARRFFPGGNAVEMWSWIVTCNTNLQQVYANTPVVQWKVPVGIALAIPDFVKAAQAQARLSAHGVELAMADAGADPQASCGCSPPVHVTSTVSLLKAVSAWYPKTAVMAVGELLRCNPAIQLENDKLVAGQDLVGICINQFANTSTPLVAPPVHHQGATAASGNISFELLQPARGNASERLGSASYLPGPGAWPDSDKATWDWYKCVPSYSWDSPRSVVTIITGGRHECQEYYSAEVDGCSFWPGAYAWAYTPACNMHDACYAWTKQTPHNWQQNDESRKRCDNEMFDRLWHNCNRWHCDTWWKGVIGECKACHDQLGWWKSVLPNVADKGLRDGRWRVWMKLSPEKASPYWDMVGTELPNFYHSLDTSYGNRQATEVRFMESFRQNFGPIKSLLHGMCIDVPSWNAGVRVYMYPCHGGVNQNWQRLGNQRENLQLQTGNNFCLDATQNRDRGTEVTAHHCHGGGGDPWQRWVYDGKQRLRPVSAPWYCLDIKYSSTNAHTGLWLWDCHDGANQKWAMG